MTRSTRSNGVAIDASERSSRRGGSDGKREHTAKPQPENAAVGSPDTAEAFTSLRAIERELRRKVLGAQSHVPTFFDNFAYRTVCAAIESRSLAGRTDEERRHIAELLRWREMSGRRLMSYQARAAETDAWRPLAWECTRMHMNGSQGVNECLSWRGRPVFKTVFDFALYPMLIWDIKPAVMIELGSGTGASAVWFGDLLDSFGIDARVLSIDIKRPAVRHPRVTFIKGDCRRIEHVVSRDELRRLPRPRIVIEDVHVNTYQLMNHFAPLLDVGDYLIVEDSRPKTASLARFCRRYAHQFVVDTRYTDFFGRNATCSADSIFVRVDEKSGRRRRLTPRS